MVTIDPLSDEFLKETAKLIKTVFPYKPDQEKARRSFKDSLSNPTSGKSYWVALDAQKHVVGVTGLYSTCRDEGVVWLGWFGVHPDFRRQHLGSRLLEFTINEATKRGYSVLMLYTSTDKNERAAHELYKKFGFEETSRDDEDTIYFAKTLSLPNRECT